MDPTNVLIASGNNGMARELLTGTYKPCPTSLLSSARGWIYFVGGETFAFAAKGNHKAVEKAIEGINGDVTRGGRSLADGRRFGAESVEGWGTDVQVITRIY